MDKRKTFAIYTLVIILLLSLAFNERRVDSKIQYTETLKKEYDKQLLSLRTELKQSESIRQRLYKDVFILRRDYNNLRRQDSIRRVELEKLRGAFDHLTPSQLQKEMIDEYRKFKKLQDRQ